MPILKVLALNISESTGTKLTRTQLKTKSPKYVSGVVRLLLKQSLECVKVSCCAKWNEEKQQLEGKLNYKGKPYQWIIEEA